MKILQSQTGITGAPRPTRPQPIRDAILAYLTEPRAAIDVALLIKRPVPTATGHLAAMRRLGLIKRLGYAAYARADYEGPAMSFRRRRATAVPALREGLSKLMRKRRRTAPALASESGAAIADVRAAIWELWLSGLVIGDDEAGYRVTVSEHARIARRKARKGRAVRKKGP